MKIELTPTEIHTLINAVNKIIHFTEQTPNTAYLLGIDTPARKTLRQILQKIHTQATAQIRKSPIQQIHNT